MFSSLLFCITYYFKSVFYYDSLLMNCFVVDNKLKVILIMLGRSQ